MPGDAEGRMMSSVAILPSWDILVQRSGRGLDEHGGLAWMYRMYRDFLGCD